MIVNLSRMALIVALIGASVFAVEQRFPQAGAAWAQDDDDGDDDDDDDDDGGGGQSSRGGDGGDDDGRSFRRDNELPRFLRNIFRQPEPQRQVRRAAPPAPPPPAYREELVVLNLSQPDLDTLIAQGFAVIEQQTVPSLNVVMRRLRAPATLDLDAARDAVRALPSGGDADFNHYYRGESCANCEAQRQIGWQMPASRDLSCGADVAIGMVDTGINPDHDTFADARLEVHRLGDEQDASGLQHGTAVAALLVGDPAGRTPGLVPHLRIVAVDAFHKSGADERADAFTLIRAMDLLSEQGVQVVNLSLAGPANTVLEQAVLRVIEGGTVIVAATGNGGARAEPAFPAAYPGVIAVTAVDRQGKVYRRAGRGAHVHLAAPGVEVWTAASISGGRPKTGTSFAAPFVSAAAARLLQSDPALTPAMVAERLAAGATDLGDPGRDDVFGHGLLTFDAACETESAPLPVSQN